MKRPDALPMLAVVAAAATAILQSCAAFSSGGDGVPLGAGDAATDAPGEAASGVVDASTGANGDSAADAGAPTYASVVLASSPLAYFRFDQTLATEPVKDEIAGGPPGTYVGAPNITLQQPGAIKGDPSTALLLTGGYVTFGPQTLLATGQSPFSIELWIKPKVSPPSENQAVVLKRDYSQGSSTLAGYIVLLGTNGALCVQRWDGTGTAATSEDSACSGPGVPTTEYTHVLATYDAMNLSLFVNGALIQQIASSRAIPTTTSDLRVGYDNAVYPTPFQGDVDELALYTHALTPAEVAAHWQAAGH